tara:strand:+ start:523 stop:954 length:432 start_codon:yes stop_codon:yes gene_type:complete
MDNLSIAKACGSDFKGQTTEEFEDDWGYSFNDCDRPGDEGRLDYGEIYFDYYLNDERRWDNPSGWDPEDPYWHGPDYYPSGFCPTIPQESPMLTSDYYDDQDQEEWEIQQEYDAQYDIGDVWTYLADALINKIEGEAWRDANT